MPETKTRLKPIVFRVNHICDRCGIGWMKWDGAAYSDNFHTFYHHKCTHCDFKQHMKRKYPRIETEYEELKENENG